ncbi:hypothetical protein [Terriglobus saanensis]|uniref:Lipoprotein n=1 Tax=Terriglobus saanensis (strain ATCC BAA-1853 / DSM 23119 / SP1PR4) TaxID=401053 RepID=E8V0Q6_TERSS|nr:hypothetical protein [Terriglobus saanensis]ADV81119.1 hypothetical protein AciPR4_0281 [Terriglobus saanensis SP1PR4]
MKDALRAVTMLSVALVCLTVSGCRIEANKGKDGKDVDFATPLGGMSIKTNKAASTRGLGITEYPGSTALEDKDKDDDRANVDMHFGNFHLKVQTAKFSTTDAPDRVLSFYRNDLAQYGTVIECQNDRPIGTPTETGQGLTCDDKDKDKDRDKHKPIHGSSHSDGLSLKAGSKRRQHIAAVEEKNGHTEITLVSLDLPGEMKSDND